MRAPHRTPTIYTEYSHTYQKIYELIISSRDNGITQSEILKRIPQVDRTTVYRNTQRLEKEGKIIIKRIGKTTTYFSANHECYGKILRASSIFSALGVNVIGMPNYISYKTLNKIQKVGDNSDSDQLERILFDFCNQVGGLILYATILGVDFTLIRQLCSSQYKKLCPSEKDNLVEFWIEKVLSSSINSIISKLIDTIGDVDIPIDLASKFSAVYPNLYGRLRFYTEGLVEETHFSLEKKNRRQQQKTCVHTFDKKESNRIRQSKLFVGKSCLKCGYWKPLRLIIQSK